MDTRTGYGGGIRRNRAAVATFGIWKLTSVGPDLYKFKAQVLDVTPPWLALDGLTVWIGVGSVAWEWSVSDLWYGADEVEAVVGAPTIGPLPTPSQQGG